MRRSTPNCERVAERQRALLATLVRLDTAQVAAVLAQYATADRLTRLRQVFASRLDSVRLVLDAPHDPHNGAAIVRSADAFGIQRIHVIERVEEFLAANSVARGSERWVEVIPHRSARDVLAVLEPAGFVCVATHPNGSLTPQDLVEMPGRVALVLGNERRGIHGELAQACQLSVRIPMRGFCESLNVSVTAAILLEAMTRNRPGDLPESERQALLARALVLTLPHALEILQAHGMTVDVDAAS